MRVTDDSDCESENDFRYNSLQAYVCSYIIIQILIVAHNRKSQMVEDRKIYVRRVSSNVCDLRKASRPLSTNIEPGAGLFETFLEVALFYDRHQHLHTPYIKSSYPNPVISSFYFPYLFIFLLTNIYSIFSRLFLLA